MDTINIYSTDNKNLFIHKIECWKCGNFSLEGIESSVNDMIIFECDLCKIYLGVCGRCNSKLNIDLYPADINIFINPLLNELYNNFNSYHLNIINLKNISKVYKCIQEYEDEFIDFFSKRKSNKLDFYKNFSNYDFRDIKFNFENIEFGYTKDNMCDNIPYWNLKSSLFEIDTEILGDIVGYDCKNTSRWFCNFCNDYFYFKI